MQPIHYADRPVAMAGAHEFWLTQSIERLPDGDPDKRVVVLMCAFARDIETGELPAPYSDDRAEHFAREALLPAREFLARAGDEDVDLALHFRVPLREIVARRADLQRVS